MVNVEQKDIQHNRFALLHEVSNLTNRVANISKLSA
jgi:glycyl-tRNA synthetase beta subunit